MPRAEGARGNARRPRPGGGLRRGARVALFLVAVAVAWPLLWSLLEPRGITVRVLCAGDAVRVSYPREAGHYLVRLPGPVPVRLEARVPARIEIMSLEAERARWRELVGIARRAVPRLHAAVWIPALPAGARAGLRAGAPCAEGPVALRAESLPAVALPRALRDAAAAGAAPEVDRRVLAAQGAAIYARRCAACHGSAGQGVQGMFPGLRGSPVVLGPVADHLRVMAEGRPGSPMKAFRGELSARELAALATFQRDAFGHGTGDEVQPWVVARLLAPAARGTAPRAAR